MCCFSPHNLLPLSVALAFSFSSAFILPLSDFFSPFFSYREHFSPLVFPFPPPPICLFLFLSLIRSPVLASLSFSFTLSFCLSVSLQPTFSLHLCLYSFFSALRSPRPSISVCTWQSVLLHCQGVGDD